MTSFSTSAITLDVVDAERWRAAKADHERYRSADPFPHAVFEDFFDPAILRDVVEEFPGPAAAAWRHQQNAQENKQSIFDEALLGPTTRSLVHALNSAPFLRWLQQLTGIEGLIPDPYLEGGGLHQILPGGHLGIHADFDRHRHLGLERRLNVLVYLNDDWDDDWGGHLELWSTDMQTRVQRIAPRFNRLVVFTTTSSTFHGHPDPLACPPDRSRRSLALYYYTNDHAADAIRSGHTTRFQARPGERLVPEKPPWIQRLVPPILVEWARALRGR